MVSVSTGKCTGALVFQVICVRRKTGRAAGADCPDGLAIYDRSGTEIRRLGGCKLGLS